MKIKRFVLMSGAIYYASGGFEDYIDSFDTREEAEVAMKECLKEEYSWAHIGDLETGEMYGEGKACNPMRLIRL